MSDYRMIYVGAGGDVSFLCDMCASAMEELSYDTYNRPHQHYAWAPGDCTTCYGSGIVGLKVKRTCPNCSGTGICSECEGQHVRSWSELPHHAKEQWLAHWESAGDSPINYAGIASLYRNW